MSAIMWINTSPAFPFISKFKHIILLILMFSSGLTVFMIAVFCSHRTVPIRKILFFNPLFSKSGKLGVQSTTQSPKHETGDNKPLIDSIQGLTLMLEQRSLQQVKSHSNELASVDYRNMEKSNTTNSSCWRPNQRNETCVPLTMEDLNIRCPKYIEQSRMKCGSWQVSPACSDSATPKSCLAILVPYRNRLTNLLLLVHHLHDLLQRQPISYGLYVIEQNDTKQFNRAKLLNIGYKLSKKYDNCDCFVFHDADKLPEPLWPNYSCNAKHPRHLVSRLLNLATKKYSPGQLYRHFFGGVVALTKQQFESVNGNSNLYYGWGREDDELSVRLRLKNWRITYAKPYMSYTNLNHANDLMVNKMAWPALVAVRKRMSKDGLNSLAYNLTGIYCHKWFTLFSVQL